MPVYALASKGDFEAALAAVINRLRPRTKVYAAALSGGADSTAMTAALASLGDTKDQPFILHALHVNHGIRSAEECTADEEACRDLCTKLNVPFTVKRIAPGLIEAHARKYGTGLEGAARRFRYEALGEEARKIGAGAILTAHTRDDLLETILMAFLRGSGPAGLGAMQAAAGGIIRPLLNLGRADVLAYLGLRGLSYRTDPSNADERFFRSKVRKKLTPFLDEHFPHWREPVRRLGETQAMAAAFVEEEAARRLPWAVPDKPGNGQTGQGKIENGKTVPENPEAAVLQLSAEAFFSQPEIIREAALFAAIDKLDSPLMETKKPRLEALRLFASGAAKAQDVGPARLERDASAVRVRRVDEPRRRR